MNRAQLRWDLGMGAAVVAIAAAFLWDARKLPPGVFEPIGPAPIPSAVAWFIIALALAMIAQAAWRLAHGAVAKADALPYRPRPIAAALVTVMTAVYVAAMSLGWISFAPATFVYVTLTVWFLAEFRPKALPVAVIISLALGLGLQYLFTRVLVTDLP